MVSCSYCETLRLDFQLRAYLEEENNRGDAYPMHSIWTAVHRRAVHLSRFTFGCSFRCRSIQFRCFARLRWRMSSLHFLLRQSYVATQVPAAPDHVLNVWQSLHVSP